jgi:hypothetical protein
MTGAAGGALTRQSPAPVLSGSHRRAGDRATLVFPEFFTVNYSEQEHVGGLYGGLDDVMYKQPDRGKHAERPC